MDKRMYGVVIPMITPMNQDGSVDEKSLVRFTEFLIEAGVNCLYPNGTNGESLLLSETERQRIAEVIVETADHKIPVFIQSGSMTTKETASHVAHAAKIGADGVGIMSPAFFPMDDESLFGYYEEAISAAPAEFPVYIYNIPGCTTSDVKPALLSRIQERFPNVAGIKYSCPDLMRIQDYLTQTCRTPDVLIGCDSLFFQCLSAGGVGTVTGPGSVFHERFNRLYRQYLEGDYAGAMETQKQIVKTDRELVGIPGIPALKALLKMRGVIENDTCRGPLRPLTKAEYQTLERIYQDYLKEEGING